MNKFDKATHRSHTSVLPYWLMTGLDRACLSLRWMRTTVTWQPPKTCTYHSA